MVGKRTNTKWRHLLGGFKGWCHLLGGWCRCWCQYSSNKEWQQEPESYFGIRWNRFQWNLFQWWKNDYKSYLAILVSSEWKSYWASEECSTFSIGSLFVTDVISSLLVTGGIRRIQNSHKSAISSFENWGVAENNHSAIAQIFAAMSWSPQLPSICPTLNYALW